MEKGDTTLDDVSNSDKSDGEIVRNHGSLEGTHEIAKTSSSGILFHFRRSLLSRGIVGDYSTVFIGHALSALIGFLTSILLARVLDKGDFGTYSVFLAMAIIFSSVIDMGMTQSLVRSGSRLRSEGNREGLSRIAVAAIKGKIIIGAIVGTLGFLFVYALGLHQELDGWQVLVLVPICGFVLSFFFMTQGILQIQRNFRKVSILLVLKGFMFLVVVIIAALLGKISLLLVCFLFLTMTAAAIIPFAGSFVRIIKTGGVPRQSTRKEIRSLFSFGKWIAISGLSFSLIEQIPVAAIFGYYGPEDAANFSVAIAMIGTLGIISVPLMTVLMPDLSRIKTKTELKEYLLTTYRFLLPLVFLVLIGFFVAAEPLITFLYGAEYADSATLLRILLIPFILAFTLLPVNLSLTYALGKPSISSMSCVAQLVTLTVVISVMSSVNSVILLVTAYGVIKAGGSIGVFIISTIFIRSSDEQLCHLTESDS